MKKNVKILVSLLAMLSLGATSCSDNSGGSTEPPVVEHNEQDAISMSIVKPNKLEYEIGESFDSTGLKVYLNFEDGFKLEVTGYSVSGFKNDSLGEVTITVNYLGFNQTFTVKFVKSLTGISARTEKTTYQVGEQLDKDSIIVTANYNDGSSEVVTNFLINGFDNSKAGQCTITITYKGKETTLVINFVRVARSISVILEDDNFAVGSSLNDVKATVVVSYNDGTTESVTSGFVISGFDSSKGATITLTFTYEGMTCTKDVHIVKKIDHIEVGGEYQTYYALGESFNKNGIVVTAVYDDETREDITDKVNFTGFKSDTLGEIYVTANYNGQAASFALTIRKADKIVLKVLSNRQELKDGKATFDVMLDEQTVLYKHDPDDIVIKVTGGTVELIDFGADLSDYRWRVTVSAVGNYDIKAEISELKSESIRVSCVTDSKNVIDKIKNVLNGHLNFGHSYDIGLNQSNIEEYSISDADGFLKINDEYKLEVIGINSGKVSVNRFGEKVESLNYAVEQTILITNIKRELITAGDIQVQADGVTNDMLADINSLSLSGQLVNDTNVLGLRYLTNLEEIDISDNQLEDVEWLSSCSKLKKVNLSGNLITSFNQIKNNTQLEYLDVSDNLVNDISQIKFIPSIKYLNLSNNLLTDISDLSTVFSLESLFLNDNPLENFKDRLSGLENLTELGLGNCNIPFTDIVSLTYLNNLTYLDVSYTSVNLEPISKLTKLKELILNHTDLQNKDLSKLNELINLTHLDISNNNIDLENYALHPLDGTKITKLEELMMGGNAFVSMPNLSAFTKLKKLDLSYSYNLVDIDSINGLSVEDLVLDECGVISSSKFNATIDTLKHLKKLSILGAFEFVTRANFDYLTNKVDTSDDFALRFIDERYLTKDSILNYKQSVFFSYDELKTAFWNDTDKVFNLTAVGDSREIILSLCNEENISAVSHNFVISSSIFDLQIYANSYNEKYAHLNFEIEDRKQSSMTFEFHNFKNICDQSYDQMFHAADGSKVIIESYGETFLEGFSYKTQIQAAGHTPKPVFDVYDLYLYTMNENSKLNITGGLGQSCSKAANGTGSDYGKSGSRGGNGGDGIHCHSIYVYSSNITITGGKGGTGGAGGESKLGGIKMFETGTSGGAGGTGGNCIVYSEECMLYKNPTFKVGDGGSGGAGGAWGGESAWGCSQGPSGSKGSSGKTTKKI